MSFPLVERALSRPRLLTLLKRVFDHQLMLVIAPPGYGKTTVTAQFVQTCTCPVFWLNLTEADRDLPALQQQVTHSLECDMENRSLSARELAYKVAQHLAQYNTPVLYVIDDAHHLLGVRQGEQWLEALLEYSPSQVHLLLLSRAVLALPTQQLLARGEITALRVEALRFTTAEVVDLAQQWTPWLAPQTVQQIAVQYQGWPAATVLALQTATVAEQVAPEAQIVALVQQLVDAQPETVREFLLAASTLPWLTAARCHEILGLVDAETQLQQLTPYRLWTVAHPQHLHFHDLTRHALQQLLVQRSAEQFSRLHLRAGAWFEQHYEYSAAFTHYTAARAINRLVVLADHHANTLFVDGQVELLLNWEQQLRTFGVISPRLWFTCSFIYTDRYQYATALQLLAEAEPLLQNDDAGMAILQLQRAQIALQQGRYEETLRLVRQHTHSTYISHRARALQLFGAAYIRLGRLEEAARILESALTPAREYQEPHILAYLLQDLNLVYLKLGRLDAALVCLQETVALRRQLGISNGLALALNNLGYHYHQCGDYAQAFATFNEALALARRGGEPRTQAYLCWSLGDLERDRGNFSQAEALYAQALEYVGSSEPEVCCGVWLSQATLARWCGKIETAFRSIMQAQQLAETHRLEVETQQARLAEAVVKGASTDTFTSAVDALCRLQVSAEKSTAFALLARHYLSVDAVPEALACLLRLQEQQMRQSGVAEIYHTPALCNLGRQHPIKFSTLIADLRQLQDWQVETVSREAPLRVYALGAVRVERGGVTITDWGSARAQELFFLLLAQGPQTREAICLQFWPEASAEQVRDNFHATLRRARKAVGDAVILFDQGLYALDAAFIDYWDVRDFQQLVQQGRRHSPRDARTVDLFQRALSCYQGDFLGHLDTSWANVLREHLQRTFVEVAVSLATTAAARGDARSALKLARQALEVDPYHEPAHRIILRAYAALSERHGGVTHYRRLVRLLDEELNIAPSLETQDLFQRLYS
jgi:LuxR family transcriptional regulator, maltose regulon positive regulatory protein